MTSDQTDAGQHPSDEAKSEQLALARDQGSAFEKAVLEMIENEAHGKEQRSGDYLVGFAVEEAEGMYMPKDGRLQWMEPSEENCHIEVVVRDAADGRFIPGLKVTLTVRDADGAEIGTHEQPFLWHPWLFHYGRNWKVPGDGRYDLSVHIDPPSFGRHDRKNGQRYAEPVDVEFRGVEITTGQKHSKAA